MTTEGDNDNERASQGTEHGLSTNTGSNGAVGKVGAHNAFTAGMIYVLRREICPGASYTSCAGRREDVSSG